MALTTSELIKRNQERDEKYAGTIEVYKNIYQGSGNSGAIDSANKTADILRTAGYEDAAKAAEKSAGISSTKKSAVDQLWDRGSEQSVSAVTLAKQKANAAKKELENYLSSDEYKQRTAEREKKLVQDRAIKQLMTGIVDLQEPQLVKDEKEDQLRAAADLAQRDAKDAQDLEDLNGYVDGLTADPARMTQDQGVMATDLKEFASMPYEDRRALEMYVAQRDADYYDTLNFTQNGIQIGRAEQQAAGLFEKYGKQRVDELAETFARYRNEKTSQEVAQAAQKQGSSLLSGTAASAAAIPAGVYSGVGGVMGYAKEAGNRTGRYSTMDPNNEGNFLGTYSGSVKSAVAQNIEEGHGTLGKVGSIVYQAVMSTAESIARVYLGGGAAGGAGLAATATFSQTMADAAKQGATPGQAALLATADAAIEYLTEKIPLDEMISAAKGSKLKALLANTLRQAGIEATTEELSLVGSLIAEAAILKDKSAYNLEVKDLMEQGMNEEEAKKQATQGIWQEAVNTALVSGLSGGFSGAASTLKGAYSSDQDAKVKADTEQAAQQAQVAPETAQTEQGLQQKQEAHIESAKKEFGDSASAANGQTPSGAKSTPNSTISVANLLGLVKGDAEKYIPKNPQSINAVDPGATPKAESTVTAETATQSTNINSPDATPKADSAGTSMNSIPQNGAEINGNSVNPEPGIKGTGAAEQNPNGSRPGTDNSVVGMQNAPSGDFKDSQTFTNTGLRSADADIREGYRQTVEQNPDAPKYEVKHNKDTMATAKERTSTPERVNAEYEYLMGKEVGLWSPEDIVTAKLATKELLKAGEAEKVTDLNIRQKEKGTSVGQETQAYAIIGTMKDSTDPATAVERATERIFAMKESDTTFRKGKDGKDFRQWQKETATEITKIGAAIDQVADGDTKGMIDIITQLSKRRGNTAWFGTRNRLTFVASGILKGMDYSDLKIIANSQLLAMTDDYRARTAMEVTMATRKNAMLTSVKTFLRNLSGNGAVGIMDSASDSSTGQLIDCILSKFTGKRTVGNDFKHSDEYMKGAMNAGKFAALCVELNIPIETDATSAYNAAYGNDTGGKYVGRTFRSTGNPAMRFMYAYQKYMSYALEVTDKIFEGGTNEAVAESLRKLENSGLSDEDIQKLGDYVGNRRTFKDSTYTGADGKEHGSTLSRIAQNIKNVGKGTGAEPVATAITDTIMPFASVPMNVVQTGIDYTVGIGKGILEMASIIKDASGGKEIDVNRQRQAATDFGRGVSGTALIGLFATAAMKGIIKVHNDDDKNKRELEQAEGLSGAQINWDAWARDLNGQSAQWQGGDVISSLDFLEPFNTHMYLGVELAQDDAMLDIPGVANATFSSVYNSLMDTPAMTGLSDFMELCTDMKAADTGAEKMDALAGYAGDVASSFVPQFARQTAQYMDGYYRDTRGNSSAEYAANNILAATPGQSQKLPQKISGLGQVQERPGFLGTFVDPTKTTTYKENEVAKFLGELSDRVGGDTSFYPDRQAPMKITDGAGREVALDGDARTTYQKTYGDKVNEFYTALIGNYDFSQLPGDLQKEALNEAKEYATQFAKAAVSDYREVPTGSTRNLMQEIVQKKTVKNIANMFTNIDTAWEYGYDDAEIKKNLESAYDVYDGLTMIAKNEMREQAEGDAARYLEVRENGITTDQYLKVKKNVDSQKVQPGFSDIRPAQELTAIASTIGLSERSLDTLMKAWMTDYDPKAKKTDTTELKYDYIRKEMGMSAEQYAKLYDIYSYESSVAGKGTADRTRDRMVNEAKLTEEQAKLVYKLFGGSYKPWKE